MDILNFNYRIEGDEVLIYCNFKDKLAQTYSPDENGNPVQDLAPCTWSVPVKDIKGMADPTDYLKQAIAEANQ